LKQEVKNIQEKFNSKNSRDSKDFKLWIKKSKI
jgi:hypothetical protein